MELSVRMKQVAALVEPCRVVADVGCDHGYVSIYLVEQGIAERAIAMDIRSGPLSRAREHVAGKGLQNRIQCRLSDGLEGLKIGEADTVVAAGMGGPLMIRIIDQGIKQGQRIPTFVLQPQSEISEVRRYLHSVGYELVQEHMLYEDGKYYTVMKAKQQKPMVWKPVEYAYGKGLLRECSPVLYEYLRKEYRQLTALREKLQGQDTEKAQKRLRELDVCLEWNREAQRYYEVKKDDELV
ncbi:MAG: class I SAM-dependent methyltransferase [Bacteroides sp.]|nr:class I SAM-dependent methyltransferase [Bacteroides sp.]MCM1549475.1 class I SAM-dependent methyltransferase [Clostridium sp.]